MPNCMKCYLEKPSFGWNRCDRCGGHCYDCGDIMGLGGTIEIPMQDGKTKFLCESCDEMVLVMPSLYSEENLSQQFREQHMTNEDLLTDSTCPCGGEIDPLNDISVPDSVLLCSNCKKSYKFCGTCCAHYPATNELCPNDHFFE